MKSLLLLSLLLSLQGLAQVPDPGARSRALAGITSSISGEWDVTQNVAGLADEKCVSFGFTGENRFSMKELSTGTFSVAVPLSWGTMAGVIQLQDAGHYNHTLAAAAFGAKLTKSLNGGIISSLVQERMNGEAVALRKFSVAAGLLYAPSETFRAGLRLVDLPANLRAGSRQLPSFVIAGIQYRPEQRLLLFAELESGGPFTLWRLAGEFSAGEHLYVRYGICTKPFTNSAGIGYHFNKFKTSLSASHHPVLGISPCVSLVYLTGKCKKQLP